MTSSDSDDDSISAIGGVGNWTADPIISKGGSKYLRDPLSDQRLVGVGGSPTDEFTIRFVNRSQRFVNVHTFSLGGAVETVRHNSAKSNPAKRFAPLLPNESTYVYVHC